MSKSFIWGFLVGVALLIVAGVGASKLQDKNVALNARLKEADERQYQIEITDATPLQSGLLSERQRIHSRVFAYYKQMREGLPDYQRISDFFAKPKGKVMGTVITVGLSPAPDPQTPEEFLRELGDKSDAVIKGAVVKKVSQITEDDSFIFTDYDVVVTEVFKDNPTSPIEVGRPILVTRPGGKIAASGFVVKADDEKFLPLPMNGEVLLFLKFIPESGAYKSTEARGGFELNGSLIRPLTGIHLPFEVTQDGSTFVQATRTALSK
ncbi:MAG TPA: hypothetical protein VJZ91_11600 [Blastocatellia bacterium]|nr:hypothetical protein [Blastocatellia bacterium]